MLICEGCGSSYDDSYKFCPQCGRAKPEVPKIQVDVSLSPRKTPFDCPLCGDAMNVQKVTAIVASSTSEGTQKSVTYGSSDYYSSASGKKIGDGYSSSTTKSSSFHQSILAAKLVPPQPPSEPKFSESNLLLWVLITVVLCLIIGCLSTMGGQSASDDITFGLIVIGLLGITIIGLWVFIFNDKTTDKSKKDEKEKKILEYQIALKRFLKAKEIWEKLYYCHKHDIVFIEGKDKYETVNKTWAVCLEWGNEVIEVEHLEQGG
jgi:hypothetical protein